MSDQPHPPEEPRPSRLARSALRLLLPRDDRDAVLSELRELWQLRVDRDGEASARRWYARQLRGYPLRLLRDRLRKRTVPAMGALRGSVTAHQDRGGTLAGVSGDASACAPRLGEVPALRIDDRAHGGARSRREHGDARGDSRGAAESPAVRGLGSTGAHLSCDWGQSVEPVGRGLSGDRIAADELRRRGGLFVRRANPDGWQPRRAGARPFRHRGLVRSVRTERRAGANVRGR